MHSDKKKFHFKQFSVNHTESSMKVGVDGVLVGLWASVDKNTSSILDVGTGCGVIALICAQRAPSAKIAAIDIDEPSTREASGNFALSPWADRMEAIKVDFNLFADICRFKFDLIISNPPYFDSGVDHEISRRMTARHEGSLSPYLLLTEGKRILSDSGKIAMIVPYERRESIIQAALETDLHLSRITDVKGNIRTEPKRTLLEFSPLTCTSPQENILTLELSPGTYTEEYLKLGHDFYLKF